MRLLRLLAALFRACPHELIRERHEGLLHLTCVHCGQRQAFGLQDRPHPIAPARAVVKPKRVKKAIAAPVVPMRRVK